MLFQLSALCQGLVGQSALGGGPEQFNLLLDLMFL